MTGGGTASQSIGATLLTIWSLAGVELSRYGMNGELELEHCLFTKFEAARQVSAAAKQGSPAYVTHTHLGLSQPRHCPGGVSLNSQLRENCPFLIQPSLYQDSDPDRGLDFCEFDRPLLFVDNTVEGSVPRADTVPSTTGASHRP